MIVVGIVVIIVVGIVVIIVVGKEIFKHSCDVSFREG